MSRADPQGRPTLKTHDRTLPGRGASVCDDWQAWLPDHKAKVFEAQSQHLEATYTMLSVSLDEALSLRDAGQLEKSFQTAGVTRGLCIRLAGPLGSLIRSMSEHAKHYGTVPNAAPLDPGNFQSSRSQWSARMSSVLSHVMLSHRAQFLHKLGTLNELVEDLHRDFAEAAGELDGAAATEPGIAQLWQRLDICHFDLNTCLRESIVLLKSFLVALPDNELAGFDQTYRSQLGSTSLQEPDRARLLRHRRMAPIAGE